MRGSIESRTRHRHGLLARAVMMAMSVGAVLGRHVDLAALQSHLEARAQVKVILGAQACQAAIQRYGGIRRISLITPYMPSGDAQVRRAFTDSGFEVVNLLGLKSNSPLLMAHESPERLRRAVREVDDPSVELILQVGTNLAFAGSRGRGGALARQAGACGEHLHVLACAAQHRRRGPDRGIRLVAEEH